MTYPAAVTTFTPKVDGVDNYVAADINSAYTDITAIETELGTDPAGTATDVKTRLAHSLSDAGYLEFDDAALLTISSGAITITQNLHRIETEAGAASDNLDTINGGAAGRYLIVRATNTAHTVIIKHAVDNILCSGGADISLDSTNEFAHGYYDGTLSKWILARGFSGSALSGAGADTQVAVFGSASTIAGTAALTFFEDQLEIASNDAAIALTGDTGAWYAELYNVGTGGAIIGGDTYHGSVTNGAKISDAGVITYLGTAKRVMVMRPALFAGRIDKDKPTFVNIGVAGGYSLPLYATDEELFFRETIPGRWDGASNITGCMTVCLASAETVGEDFRMQLSWSSWPRNSGAISASVMADVEVQTELVTDRAAQYSIYQLTFTIDYTVPTPDLAVSDHFAGRIRRIPVTGGGADEVDGEIILLDFCMAYTVDKVFRAPA